MSSMCTLAADMRTQTQVVDLPLVSASRHERQQRARRFLSHEGLVYVHYQIWAAKGPEMLLSPCKASLSSSFIMFSSRQDHAGLMIQFACCRHCTMPMICFWSQKQSCFWSQKQSCFWSHKQSQLTLTESCKPARTSLQLQTRHANFVACMLCQRSPFSCKHVASKLSACIVNNNVS